jgi:hypothetical protein
MNHYSVIYTYDKLNNIISVAYMSILSRYLASEID